jgi:uncharacterized membrane protein (UPF0127 family)
MPRIFTLLFLLLFLSNLYAKEALVKCCMRNFCLNARIADTDAERARGLMGVAGLAENEGMLFVFDKEDIYIFWMKNTLIPLDIIWLDAGKKIVDIREDAMPCINSCDSFVPAVKAKYALEVNAGFVLRHKIKVGDTVSFNLP